MLSLTYLLDIIKNAGLDRLDDPRRWGMGGKSDEFDFSGLLVFSDDFQTTPGPDDPLQVLGFVQACACMHASGG